METQLNKDFNEKVEAYKEQLKTVYQQKVAEADDKNYAKEFYRSSIFEQNPNTPKNSYFFNLLSSLLLHNYRLNKTTAFEKTINELGKIRERAEVFTNTLIDVYTDEDAEPITYLEEENLETELYLLSLDLKDLVKLLALFLATKLLLKEFPKDESVEVFSIDRPIEKKTTHNRKLEATVTFSESQQILALHYLLEHLGLHTRRDHNLSDFARFAHLLSRTQITTIDNSPKLSMTKRLFNPKNDHPSLKDLLFIKPFFEKMGLDGIVSIINNEIKYKNENI